MGSKIEYVKSSQIYATNYARNSKAVGVLWAIFTVCYGIIVVVSFVSPEWIGDVEGETPGKFGLWSACYAEEFGEKCKGKIDDIFTISNNAFLAAAIFIGVGVITALLTICTMILYFFCQSTNVYLICGWLQLLSAICMIVGCTTFPAGWAYDDVRRICGASDIYALGGCSIRWAYLLAGISCLDAIILATLAFILATRHVRLQPDPYYIPGNLYKGEMNNGFIGDAASVAGSRKSLNLHPVLLMHPGQDDTYSQFSQRTVPRSIHSGHYASPMQHNFQL